MSTSGRSAAQSTWYLVEFDYKAEQADELTIAKGELLHDAEQEEDGWLRGCNAAGRRGLFPDNFVKACRPASLRRLDAKLRAANAGLEPGAPVYALEPLPSATAAGNGGGGGATATVYVPKLGTRLAVPLASLDFDGAEPRQQQLHEQQQQPPRPLPGMVPASKSFPPPVAAPKQQQQQQQPPPALPEKPKQQARAQKPQQQQSQPDYVIVIHPYKAEHQDELTIKIDDVIRVIDRSLSDEGWWRGELDGRVGVFPDNFVEPCAATGRTAASAGPARPLQAPPAAARQQVPSAQQQQQHQQQSSNESLVSDHLQTPQSLAHPNSGRPKQPGKRPPNSNHRSGGPIKDEFSNHDAASLTTPTQQQGGLAEAAGDSASAVAELHQEVRRLRIDAAERERELQELTKFKRSALESISGLKEEVDAIKKSYHACCVDMDRMKREILTLTNNQ